MTDKFVEEKQMEILHRNVSWGTKNHHGSNRGGFGVTNGKAKGNWVKNNIHEPMEENNSWHVLQNKPRANKDGSKKV